MNRSHSGAWWSCMAITAAMALFGASAFSAAAATQPMTDATEESLTARSRFLMGTPFAITVAGAVDESCFTSAFDEVARLEAIMSNWMHDSEMSRLNRAAASGSNEVVCSPELFDAIDAALRWAERSGGAFDPTVEPLVRDLGLRDRSGRLPGEAPATEPAGAASGMPARAPIGWRNVVLDPRRRTVRFATPGAAIDLGGIGKGIALDAAARVLKEAGVRAALLDFGGQALAFGPRDGAPGWTVAIADPGDRSRVAAVVVIGEGSLATSGNGERSIPSREGPVGQILDPASRRPAPFTGSVTVAAGNATDADALSTALFVMGPERGSRWAEEQDIAALFLWREAQAGPLVRETSRFRSRFEDRESTERNR